ncbi:four helix bundle protein [Polaribacter ponticola]|uniref:Four helix bundle protein n=1 Tax=Polaribacter ponticola TaxID=2978475 RepID=A0ABT5SBX0_9FLAO|nr:four helix bundle protein [Polaribacter sp. MSW5]MDD7915624.1 four helix bundle protein [Polaribacter sp. MSW5]
MSSIKSYKELIVWQKSMKLVTMVYELSKTLPTDEKFGLISQMRRCSVSIPSNIAEGWGRLSRKNYIQFLRISRGSLFELETQVLITKELNYINDSVIIESLIIEISKMLNSLIKKLEEKN